ncbi:MAG: penicillin acylase family protein [Candidatus Thermoplasmatota archaeon]|nr:penicillin acylase family protein [Candidatus Thermoplasmatota archaeon]
MSGEPDKATEAVPEEKKPKSRRAASPRRKRVRAAASFLVPLVLLIVVGFVLNGTLVLLDPEVGIFTDATYSSWGNQSFTLSGLQHKVTVVRNGAGTVYIYAADDADLFYAQGFVQASDRLFQMEAQSMMAQGNLSSWLGPSALGSDMTFRYLGIPHAAAQMATGLPSQDPAVAADFNAFSDGVNAYIAYAEAHNALPLPFKALGVSPFHWTPFASLCFERLMVLSQTAGIVEPLEGGLAAATLGDSTFNHLYPIYPPYYQNYTVLPGNGSVNNVSLAQEQGVNSTYVFSQDWSQPWATGIPTAETQQLIPLLRAALANVSDPFLPGLGAAAASEGVGSNSWVVSANKTGLGMPLLANDPHLPLQLPSLWIPTNLNDPSYGVSGWALAGLPGILIGHDGSVAWGLTYSGGATAEDYVETLQGDSYLSNGTWHPFTYQNQTISVNGGASVSLSVPWTNNGPLVGRIGNYGISVRWAGSGPTWELLSELLFDRAVSISQMTGILEKYWHIPTLNFMMAEHNATTGANHIGWIIPAKYPLIRVSMPNNQSVEVIGSRGPLNGSGGYEPVGAVPSNLSPQVVDPARGYLYAPNQPTVGQEYPFPFIGSWWDPGGRAQTIGNYLNTHPSMPPANMQALQANVTDSWAVMYAPILEKTLQNISASNTGSAGALAKAALPYLTNWNGSFQTGEVGPTIYSYWWNEILNQVYTPLLPKMGLVNATPPDPNEVFSYAFSDPNATVFPGGWAAVSTSSAVDALDLLQAHLGGGSSAAPDLSGWTWGRVHALTIPSILGYPSFAEGPYPQWGDGYTPGVAHFSPALTVPLTQVSIGSSLRMVTTPSDGPSWGIIPGGTSENIGSNYYDNQLPLWLNHKYVDMSVISSDTGPFPMGVVSTWRLSP